MSPLNQTVTMSLFFSQSSQHLLIKPYNFIFDKLSSSPSVLQVLFSNITCLELGEQSWLTFVILVKVALSTRGHHTIRLILWRDTFPLGRQSDQSEGEKVYVSMFCGRVILSKEHVPSAIVMPRHLLSGTLGVRVPFVSLVSLVPSVSLSPLVSLP